MDKEEDCLLDLAEGHAGTSPLKERVVTGTLCKGMVAAVSMEF